MCSTLTVVLCRTVIIAGLSALATGKVTAQDNAYRIGVVSAMTGPGLPSNIYGKQAAELMADAVNSGTLPPPYAGTKGIAGRPIELVFIDENGGSAKQVSEFRALVERKNVDAVMGFGLAPTCLAIAPVADELKVLTLMSTCGTPRIFEEGDHRYSFRTSGHSTMDGVALARYAVRRWPNATKYGHINPNMAFGQDSWRDFSLALRALKPDVQIAAELWPTFGSGQYGAEISSIGTRAPQIVHTALFGSDLEGFITQMSQRGLQADTNFLASSLDLSIYRLGEHIPDGVVFGARGLYSVFAPGTEIDMWFASAFEKRFKAKPVYTGYQYAQSLFALVAAVRKVQASSPDAPDRERIIDALAGLEFDGLGGKVRMSLGKGHQAVTGMSVGEYVYDKDAKMPKVRNVMTFAAECVNPPDNMNSVAWLEKGMPGAKCD